MDSNHCRLSQRIYSPPPLATRALLRILEQCQKTFHTMLNCWSWWRESNPQPADYKSAALPLSHTSILLSLLVKILKKLATWNGLEPSTSSVTGWHSNQLNYQAIFGGRNRARTYDPLLVRQVLSQLSYTPEAFICSTHLLTIQHLVSYVKCFFHFFISFCFAILFCALSERLHYLTITTPLCQ